MKCLFDSHCFRSVGLFIILVFHHLGRGYYVIVKKHGEFIVLVNLISEMALSEVHALGIE